MATYRKNINFNRQQVPTPIYKDHQLLGDSQFVRFSEKILSLRHSMRCAGRGTTPSRCIGHCVSGQKIDQLKSRLESCNYKVHNNVILLIGTNDMLSGTSVERMCVSYNEIVKNLVENCDNILLLTIPPVPKLGDASHVWEKLIQFNQFIKGLGERSTKINVVDLAGIIAKANNTSALEYYEKTFHPSSRVDLVHLNLKAFRVLRVAMDIHYFERKWGRW